MLCFGRFIVLLGFKLKKEKAAMIVGYVTAEVSPPLLVLGWTFVVK